ncbi:hypothetical protein, partial [Enterococcus faecium]|uniref:hypothetical protein n=1 Tax=Enterococcus faecium TaxID=1352 RepID=UPI003D9FF2EE
SRTYIYLANGISKLELALGICMYQNDIGGLSSKRKFGKKMDVSFKMNGRFVQASNGHRKPKGRIKQNRLQNLYFMAMEAGIGKCSGFLSP